MSSPHSEAGCGLSPNYPWTMYGEGINQKRLGKEGVGGWELRASLGTGRLRVRHWRGTLGCCACSPSGPSLWACLLGQGWEGRQALVVLDVYCAPGRKFLLSFLSS